MAFIETPHGANVKVAYRMGTDPVVSNGFWFTRTGFDQANLDFLTEQVSLWWRTNILPLLGPNITYFNTIARDMRTVGAQQSIDAIGQGSAGGQVGQSDDMATACVVTLRTARIGRSFRGRSYVRGISAGDIANNILEGAFASGVADAYDLLLVDSLTWGWVWVVRSTQIDGAPQDPAVTTPIIDTEVRSDVVGHQRRSVRRP